MKKQHHLPEKDSPAPDEETNQGKRPDQVETTMKIIEWTVFVAVFAAFGFLLWKIGTLTWNFLKLIF